MAIKIDLEKVFGRIEWSFIRDTLHFFGIPNNLSKLIMSCITTSSIQILVNGRLTDAFYPSRGIRQGDPMSPYIFIMCMERLSKTISNLTAFKDWNPIKISPRGPNLSHLFFVDDLTLSTKADARNCHTIARTLHDFWVASKLIVQSRESSSQKIAGPRLRMNVQPFLELIGIIPLESIWDSLSSTKSPPIVISNTSWTVRDKESLVGSPTLLIWLAEWSLPKQPFAVSPLTL